MSELSPLTRRVLFRVCLAIAASILTGVCYYTADLPQLKSVPVPDNKMVLGRGCDICQSNCEGKKDYYTCKTECNMIC